MPITAERADDLWAVHADDAVAEWYPLTRDEALARARAWGEAWESDGICKWLAYERGSGELVGRGGSSLLPDGHAKRAISALIPAWDGYEIGWALRSPFWGRGYATEIGRAGLELAFSMTDVVVAFTERHNIRSRAVMERLGMSGVGEITAEGLVEGRAGVHGDAPFAVYAIERP